MVSYWFFLACCRVLPTFPSWTVQTLNVSYCSTSTRQLTLSWNSNDFKTFQSSPLGMTYVLGVFPPLRVKSTNSLFILGEDPFIIFTIGISWDSGYTQGIILLRLASNSIHLCGWLIFRAWNAIPPTLDYFGMIRMSYSTDHWTSVFIWSTIGTSKGAPRCSKVQLQQQHAEKPAKGARLKGQCQYHQKLNKVYGRKRH